MSGRYPEIVYTEEGMREGMQIESKDIPVDQKGGVAGCPVGDGPEADRHRLLRQPEIHPADGADREIVTKFHSEAGRDVHRAGAEREGGRARQAIFAAADHRAQQPPVAARASVRRVRPAQHQPLADAGNGGVAEGDRRRGASGAKEAGIGTNATFGSNFVGDFSVDMTMKFLEKQHALWDAVGIRVTGVSIGDPMGWCHPVKVEEIFTRVKRQWPEIKSSALTCTTRAAWRSPRPTLRSRRWMPMTRCTCKAPSAA